MLQVRASITELTLVCCLALGLVAVVLQVQPEDCLVTILTSEMNHHTCMQYAMGGIIYGFVYFPNQIFA